MFTPKNFRVCLKEGVITEDMLMEAIYSVDKRVAYHCSMEFQYRCDGDAMFCDNRPLRWRQRPKYDEIERNRIHSAKRKTHFLLQKDILLTPLEPIGIHTCKHYKELVLWEDGFLYDDVKDNPNVVRRAKGRVYHFEGPFLYYSMDLDKYIVKYDEKRCIRAADTSELELARQQFVCPPIAEDLSYLVLNVEPSLGVYVYYKCGNYKFHMPVTKDSIYESDNWLITKASSKYPNLPVTEVSDKSISLLSTELPDILDSQFTDKVVTLIAGGNYVFQPLDYEEFDCE